MEKEEFKRSIKESLTELAKADQQTREALVNDMNEELRDKLSDGGKRLLDDICSFLIEGVQMHE